MTKQEFDLKYRGEKVLVYCDSIEKYRAFRNIGKRFGYYFANRKDESISYWGGSTTSAHYIFNDYLNGFVIHFDVDGFIKRYNYKVVEFELEKEN